MEFSIVIPCFQSATVLKSVLEEITKVLKNNTYEIILVDDGNQEKESQKLIQIAEVFPQAKIEKLTTNKGQHQATLLGCKEAKGDFVVTMDDDGQHNPEVILKMKDLSIQYKADIVYANFTYRQERHWRTILRRLLSRQHLKSSFRLWTKEVNEQLKNTTNQPPQLLDHLILKISTNIKYLPTKQRKSLLKKSRYGFWEYYQYCKLVLNNENLLRRHRTRKH